MVLRSACSDVDRDLVCRERLNEHEDSDKEKANPSKCFHRFSIQYSSEDNPRLGVRVTRFSPGFDFSPEFDRNERIIEANPELHASLPI